MLAAQYIILVMQHKLVCRVIWERVEHELPRFYGSPEKPLLMRTFGTLRKLKNAWILRLTTVCPTSTQKQEKLNRYPGVAQLGARVVWDHQAAGSIPVTRTNLTANFRICGRFFNLDFYLL